MNSDSWIQILLEKMHKDIDEIKKDVKDLKERKFKIEGAYVALTIVTSGVVSFLTIYFSTQH